MKDNNGQWCTPQSKAFLKTATYENDNKITAYRYWFDDDFENHILVTLTSPVNPYELDKAFEIPETFQYDEEYVFQIQFQDVLGKWSSLAVDTFTYLNPACGCTDLYAENYNPKATINNGSCIYRKIEGEISGCTNATSLNYNPLATNDDDSCIDEAGEEPIYGCTDLKALNFNPLATDYDYEKPECQCVYANEENIFNADIDETPVDTIGARAKESCDLSTGLGITSAVIIGITPTDGKNILVHWEIVQDGNTFTYDVEYTISQEGNNLFYLSIICKEGGGASQAKPLRSASEANISVTGYTVSAIFNVDFGGVGICLPKAISNLVVYPNPTKGKLIIDNGQWTNNVRPEPIDNVEIFDVFGKKQLSIINYQLSIVNSIDISHLPNGIYFLKIDNRMIKIIKN